MILRLLICSFLMLGMTFTLQAQLQKGSWMVNGTLRQDRYTRANIGQTLNSFGFLLAPELSYMVTNNLMLGGKLSIGISGNDRQINIPVNQHLLVRHYFKNLDNFYLFYGGTLAFGKFTTNFRGGGNTIARGRSANLQSGMQVFLQKAIALEFLFNYNFINFSSGNGRTRDVISDGFLRLEGRFQFFINHNKKPNLEEQDFRIYPGSWLIGGNFQLGLDDFVRPEIHRFWGSGWTTGLRCELGYSSRNSSLGCTSLIRKYFRPEKKGKLWLQAGIGMKGDYRRTRNRDLEEYWATVSRDFSLEGTLGWSNFISPNFTLDFFISRSYTKTLAIRRQTETQNVFSMGFVLSGLLKKNRSVN